jgi:hypothetical protein
LPSVSYILGVGQVAPRVAQKGVASALADLLLPRSRILVARNVHDRPHIEFALRKNGLFLEFSLCLSRACLGKMIVVIIL